MTTKLEQAAQNLLDYFDRDDCGILFDNHMKALREALAKQAEQEPLLWGDDKFAPHERPVKQEPVMDYERLNALREGEQNGAEDAYFFVRPENDTPTLRKMFCQGFERGFHKGLKYTSHAHTKDLTDVEIADIVYEMNGNEPTAPFWRDLARAVIAADREKNK